MQRTLANTGATPVSGATPATTYALSVTAAVLALIASVGGLFMAGLYRDNDLVTAAFRGNDLITLAIAVPLLLWALFAMRRGSTRAQLVWLAMMGYMLYNYVFYLYGAAFNVFFLLYVALVILAIAGLVFELSRIDAGRIARRFRPGAPIKWISGFMLVFGLLLGGLWVAMSLAFVFTGEVPQPIVATGHPTGVVFATDLALLVPSMLLGAILLWRRQSWGYVLSTMLTIKGATYALALIVMSLFAVDYGRDPFLLLWVVLGAGCLISCWLLLRNLAPAGN
jgi:hypothetical protein